MDKKGLFIGKQDSLSSVVKHIFSLINDEVSCWVHIRKMIISFLDTLEEI